MRNYRDNRRKGLRYAAILVAALFVFFGILAPALHRHESAGTPPDTAHKAGMAASVSLSHMAAAGVMVLYATPAPADDCPLCQWLTGTLYSFAAPVVLLLAACAVMVRLQLAVRLAALCARPAPRRGLRAPPVFALAA